MEIKTEMTKTYILTEDEYRALAHNAELVLHEWLDDACPFNWAQTRGWPTWRDLLGGEIGGGRDNLLRWSVNEHSGKGAKREDGQYTGRNIARAQVVVYMRAGFLEAEAF